MSDAQSWFLVILLNVASLAALVGMYTDWYDRPPLSWLVSANQWMTDRMVRPWLDPVLRRLGSR